METRQDKKRGKGGEKKRLEKRKKKRGEEGKNK